MASFKNILLGLFIVLFVGAILVFSGVINIGGTTQQQKQVTVTIWGPFSRIAMSDIVTNFNNIDSYTQLAYTQVDPENLHQQLIEAIASGNGPDMVIFSSENFLQDVDKLFVTPFTTYPERTFRDTYVDGGSVFLNTTGVVLYPLVVDPMVTYYNKDLLAAAKYIYPPKTWSGLNQSVPLFLKKDKIGITQSAIAMGESPNMQHFKKIFSTLLLQSGVPVISFDASAQRYIADIYSGVTTEVKVTPQDQALMYYESFADPTSQLYSWNKKLPEAQDAFLSGKTAFYLAPASELFDIQKKNPNLNFDVSPVFQPDNAVRPITYGTFYGIGIIKNSPNVGVAYSIANTLSGKDTIDAISKQLSLPPARRDLLQTLPSNPYAAVFFNQALQAFGWPDPDKNNTDSAFRDMIRKAASGEWGINQALYETQNQIQSYIK